MPAHSRRTRPGPDAPLRSDVPTRSTGYDEELERIRAWEASQSESSESESESTITSDHETETPLLDEAFETETVSETISESESESESVLTSDVEQVHEVEAFDPNAKLVSAKAMQRLSAAKGAIAHTKKVLDQGAGNQFEALQATNFNSYFRMACMRDPECWELDPALYGIAQQYPDALTAAKADLAKGGNCGEHAMLAFDYLRMTMSSDVVNRCDVTGFDHAFVILGRIDDSETDADLAVCDPWPTAPTACLWEDHFAYRADRGEINTRNTVTGDDADVKAVLAAGLKLTAKGEAMCEQALSEQETEKELEKGTEGEKPWIWRHSDTTSGGPQSYREAPTG